MKYTLLDLVQTIASSTGGDEVNSITDTVESEQYAKIIRSAYFDIITRADLPSQYTIFQLESSLDPLQPVVMTLPTNMQSVEWVKYNTATVRHPEVDMEPIKALSLSEFLHNMYMKNPLDTHVKNFTKTVNGNPIQFFYNNNGSPTCWTTYDDGTIIFDSYDATVDTTLQKSKSVAYGKKVIPWEMTDTFVPDLDESEFSLLLNEAKSLAFAETKQTQHQLADRNAHRGWNKLQKQKTKLPTRTDFDALPNFSRL